MKHYAFIALVAAALAVCASAESEELYSDKYDHMDIEAILANDRLRMQYYNCLLETAPCLTPDAVFLKEKFPEAIVTKCRKCTERQKKAFDTVAIWFDKNDPEAWDVVIRKAVSDFQKAGAARAKKT